MDEVRRRTARRCPTCHARLRASEGMCAACGATIPWRLTGVGIAVEGMAALAAAAGIVTVALLWRGRGGEWQLESRAPFEGVISIFPTEPATFTPSPPAATSLPPSTPFPPKAALLPPVIDYSVQSGDTLYGIAIEHGVSLDDILEANGETLESVHSLSIGQVLRIPNRSAEGVAEPVAIAEDASTGDVAENPGADDPGAAVSIEGNEGAESAAPSSVTGAEAQPAAPPAEPIILREATTYTIGRGDTLGRIAVEHGVRVEDLVLINELSGPSAILAVGDSLVIEPALVVTAVPAPKTLASATSSILPKLDPGRVAALPDDEIGDIEPEFSAPIELAPLDGAQVTAEAAMLRWASVGRMPFSVFYVAEIREIDEVFEEVEDAEMIWLRTDATGLRVPARYRPALGAKRRLAWRVTIRREGTFLDGRGTLLSQPNHWRVFEWAPGGPPDAGIVGATLGSGATIEPTEGASGGTP